MAAVLLARASLSQDRFAPLRLTLTPASLAALTASAIIAVGSSLGGHLRFLLGVPVTVAGCGVACLAARRDTRALLVTPAAGLLTTLSAMAAVGLAAPSPNGAAWYELVYRAHPAIALVTIGIFAGGPP